jgi:arylsulfatase A-like enzyme
MAESFLAKAKKPVFLMVHLHEPHDPYDAPPGFRGMYAGAPPSNLRHDVSSGTYGHYAAELQPAVDYYRDQYEESVRYLDETIGEFLRRIDVLLGPDTYALIFTGDHGESFERGYMNHGEHLFESSTHVPLIIRFPLQSEGSRLGGAVQSVDIAPTVLSIAGITIPPWMDGHALHSDRAPEARATFAINYKDPVGQEIYPLPTQLAIWSLPYKLIVSCDSGRGLLFNLAADPDEEVDLSLRDRTAMQKLEHLLKLELSRQSKDPKISCSLNH